jgi:peptidase C39-like protein
MTLDHLMNINYWGLGAAVLSLLCFRFAYWHAKTSALGTRTWVALACLPPSFLAAGSVVYYFHVIPEWAWYYELRSWPGSEFLMVFLGTFLGILATGFPRWMLALWLMLLMACAAVPFAKPVIAPLAESEISDRWKGAVCLQSTASTCGPASVATVLKKLGCSVTEREVARESYSYMGGTEAWYLARFVRSKGLSVHFEIHEGFAPEAGVPAVVGVRVGGGHFITILERNGRDYLVADPLFGELRLTEKALRDRYDFSGFYMVISKEKI